MIVGDNGIITQARKAKEETNSKDAEEKTAINEAGRWINEQTREVRDKIPISKEISYVGCYADIDDDGTIDGIIYADLTTEENGNWGDNYGEYAIPSVDDKNSLKDYYISRTNYTANEGFGTHEVISPIEPNGTGKARFYIMALKNINPGNVYCWYKSACDYQNSDGSIGMKDYKQMTAEIFGAGKKNTNNMIAKWNLAGYGEKYEYDMWGQIQEQVKDGWFVPSKEEWAAFAGKLGITSDNYGKYNLSNSYWSSSQINTTDAWFAYFLYGNIDETTTFANGALRLSTTF